MGDDERLHIPGLTTAQERGIEVQVRLFDPNACATALDAAHELAVDAARMLKTLVVTTDDDRCVLAVVPIERRVALNALAQAIGAKRCVLADPATVGDATGSVIGELSPLGTTELLPTVVDAEAMRFDTVFVSGGRRGIELELRPQDLVDCCEAVVAPIAR